MRLLFLLTYYRPHLSGLTVAAARRAEALAARGHAVTVLTSRQNAEWPLEETLRGVRVVRLPVIWRAGKGVLLSGYRARLGALAAECDAVVLCLPGTPLEAWSAARWTRRLGKPLLIEYACDLRLPGGLGARLVEAVAGWGHAIAARSARAIVFTTEDYAAASPYAARFREKVRIILPMVEISVPDPAAVGALRQRHAPRGERLIGFAGRLAAEKGIHVLLDALERLLAAGHDARLLMAGDTETVIGEAAYRRGILTRLGGLGDRCRLLGVVEPDLSAFYAACDVLALPSLNCTESFGLVQAEAMLCGTPVVASDLPGVRMAVRWTGFGRIVPPGDAGALAEAIAGVLAERAGGAPPPECIRRRFAAEDSIGRFEALLEECVR
jgi:glycosyltransferase involved in cell wall biosynthesis